MKYRRTLLFIRHSRHTTQSFYQFKRTLAPSSHIGQNPKDDTEHERS